MWCKVLLRLLLWTVLQEDGGTTSWGCGVEGQWAWEQLKHEAQRKCKEKDGQSGDSATKQSVTLCAVVPLSLSSPVSPLFFSLIEAHSLVFHHTYPHLNFTNPIYCYLYPWLLLSLLLLLLLLWLELLSLRAIFSFISMVFKYWFSELGGLFGQHKTLRALCPKEEKKKRVRDKNRSSYWVLFGMERSCHFALCHFLSLFPKNIDKTCLKKEMLRNCFFHWCWWQSTFLSHEKEKWQVWLCSSLLMSVNNPTRDKLLLL